MVYRQTGVSQKWRKELENASARYHISYLEAMKIQIQQHAELLSTIYESGMTDFLINSYTDQFYHTAYEIAKGTGIGTELVELDPRKIDVIICKPWAQDGKNFSDRIWTNKDKLIQNLHTELSQCIIRGESSRRAIENLLKIMGVSKSQAQRLILMESAAISAAATKQCYEELEVTQFEVVVTLDGHICTICQSYDGLVFPQKEYMVGLNVPPFHPSCRCTTVPYFEDEFTKGEQRSAKDESTGKTYYVPADITYKEWKENYINTEKLKTDRNENYRRNLNSVKLKLDWKKELHISEEIRTFK